MTMGPEEREGAQCDEHLISAADLLLHTPRIAMAAMADAATASSSAVCTHLAEPGISCDAKIARHLHRMELLL